MKQKNALMKLVRAFAVLVAGLAVIAQPANGAEGSIISSIKGDLVESAGKRLKKFDESPLAGAKYFAIYYSAAWCGPCRKFTPDLVQWYKSHKKANPHFELIFVSSDNSEDEMAGYMKEDGMPWPALDFSKKKSNRTLTQYGGRGIPNLVFIDSEGKVLSSSYQGETYVGPRKVLADIEKTLKSNPPSADAVAAANAAQPAKAGSSGFDDFFKKKPVGQ